MPRLFTQEHEWIDTQDGVATVGITDHAQAQLGDLVYIGLPEAGDTVSAGEPFADVESVKAVSEMTSPVTGRVSGINEGLLDSPELVNRSPYEAWFIRVEDVTETVATLTAEEYRTQLPAE